MIILLIRGDGYPESFDVPDEWAWCYRIACEHWWHAMCADAREG